MSSWKSPGGEQNDHLFIFSPCILIVSITLAFIGCEPHPISGGYVVSARSRSSTASIATRAAPAFGSEYFFRLKNLPPWLRKVPSIIQNALKRFSVVVFRLQGLGKQKGAGNIRRAPPRRFTKGSRSQSVEGLQRLDEA